jgi:hypothetical protein
MPPDSGLLPSEFILEERAQKRREKGFTSALATQPRTTLLASATTEGAHSG